MLTPRNLEIRDRFPGSGNLTRISRFRNLYTNLEIWKSGIWLNICHKKKFSENIKKVKKNILPKLHREITNDVTYDKALIKYNTPTIIYYNNKEFKINTRKYY